MFMVLISGEIRVSMVPISGEIRVSMVLISGEIRVSMVLLSGEIEVLGEPNLTRSWSDNDSAAHPETFQSY